MKVAKNSTTGLYFNGTNFKSLKEDALPLQQNTTKEDFALVWGGTIEIEEMETPIAESLAERIHRGEIDRYKAARIFVISQLQENPLQKTFTIRTTEKYISRVVYVPANSIESVYVKFCGEDVALIWKNGELSTDRF